MNDKLTLATLAFSLLAASGCTEQVAPKAAAPAAGALNNVVPKVDSSAVQPTPAAPQIDAKAPGVVPSPAAPPVAPDAKAIAPIAPPPPSMPGSLGGTRFGLRHRAGRTVIRVA